MKHLAENIILQKIREGDQVAFRYIYDVYFQRLLVFSQRFVGEDQAKDLVQDCFFQFWVNRKKIEINRSLSAYLFTVIKNRCFKILKDEQRKDSGTQNFGLKLKQEELAYFINSEKSILEFDIRDRVQKTMENLPPACAGVFRESRFEGLSNKEIAEKHNISVKAVEKHISKALHQFREEFKDVILVLLAFLFKK